MDLERIDWTSLGTNQGPSVLTIYSGLIYESYNNDRYQWDVLGFYIYTLLADIVESAIKTRQTLKGFDFDKFLFALITNVRTKILSAFSKLCFVSAVFQNCFFSYLPEIWGYIFMNCEDTYYLEQIFKWKATYY